MNIGSKSVWFALLLQVLVCSLLTILSIPVVGQETREPSETVEILADIQEKVGERYRLRGNVEVRFRGMKLKADEVTYDGISGEATARGNVEFKRENETVHAREGTYNLRTGRGP